jgi:hypothetical protein
MAWCLVKAQEQLYLYLLSLKVKHDVLNMIQKANETVCSRNSRYPHDPRKLAFRNHKWTQFWSLSSTLRELFILTSLHKVKESTKRITRILKYWSSYVKLFIGKGLNFDPVIGLSTVTMHELIRRSLWSRFWPENRTEVEYPLYSPDLALNDFWLSSKIKSTLKGWRFQDTEDIQKKCDDGTDNYPKTGLT